MGLMVDWISTIYIAAISFVIMISKGSINQSINNFLYFISKKEKNQFNNFVFYFRFTRW